MPRQAFLPRLQTIDENRDEPIAQDPEILSQSTALQSSPGAAGALWPRPGGTTTAAAASAPVVTSPSLAPPYPSQFQEAVRVLEQLRKARRSGVSQQPTAQQLQEATRTLEQLRQASEYRQRRQQALAAEAGLQQALAAEAERLQSQVLILYTVDGGAAGYEIKWEELHPVSQGRLLQIEDKVREYRDDSKRLDQCNHLDDVSPLSFEFDAGEITQEVVSISTIMNREKISTERLMIVIKEIMWSTDFAIRSYVKLRPRFVHLSAEAARHSGSSGAQTDFSQLLTMAPSFNCYSSATRRPSSFVRHTLARFEDHLGECCKLILELEQLVRMKDDKTFAETLESLSKVMSNVHDFLIHVASKVEHIHQSVETMRTQYLNDRRCWGDLSNPFLKANRREEAKQEAAARIMHPMLHLSSPGPVMSSQLLQTSFPTVATSPSSYPTLPLPSVLPPSSMQTSQAPLINPFSSPGSVFKSTPVFGFTSAGRITQPLPESELVEKRCRTLMSKRNDMQVPKKFQFYEGHQIFNTMTWNLDGCSEDVTNGHMFTIGHYRLWNCINGMILDVSRLFGPRRVLYTTACSGTFYLKFSYREHQVTLIIDGREGWVYGLQNDHGTFEFDQTGLKYLDEFQRWRFLTDFLADYSKEGLCPNGLGNIPVGIEAVQFACEVLSQYKGELHVPDIVRECCAILILYGPEALKFNFVFDKTIPSLSEPKKSMVSIPTLGENKQFPLVCNTLDTLSPFLSPVMKHWSNFGGVSLEHCMWKLSFPELKPEIKLSAVQGAVMTVDRAIDALNVIPINRVPSPGRRVRDWKAFKLDTDAHLSGGRPHMLSPDFARRWPYNEEAIILLNVFLIINNRPDDRFITVGRNLEFSKYIRKNKAIKAALELFKRLPK